jgi:hypothetical protein
MSQMVASKLAAVRAKHLSVQGAAGAALFVAILLACGLGGATLDWLFDFPWLLRLILLLGYLSLAGYFLFDITIRHFIRRPDDEEVALWVEHEQPTLDSRLIATVQFAHEIEEGNSVALVEALRTETEDLARNMDFQGVVKTRELSKYSLAAAGLVLMTILLWFVGGQNSQDLAARVLLSTRQVPTKTRIESVTGDCKTAVGDDLTLTAKVTGWKPSTGVAEITYASGRVQSLSLERSKTDNSVYSGVLQSVPESFTYRFLIYDGKTAGNSVKAIVKPAVVSLSCGVVYPPYTNMGTVNKQPGDLAVLAGSRLQLRVLANKPVKSQKGPVEQGSCLTLFTSDRNNAVTRTALVVAPSKPKECFGEVLLPASATGFSLQLADDEGLISSDPTVYRIDIIADRPPTVAIVFPDRKETLVTRQGSIDLAYKAEDDFGVASVSLHYRLDGDKEQTLDLPVEKGKTVKGQYSWVAAKVARTDGKEVNEGATAEYWLEATDTNNTTGPGKASSEHYQVRLVTKGDKQQELIERMAEQLNSMRSVTERQDNASRDLSNAVSGGGKKAPDGK